MMQINICSYGAWKLSVQNFSIPNSGSDKNQESELKPVLIRECCRILMEVQLSAQLKKPSSIK